MSLSEREKMWDESFPAETTEPEPDLGSQETPMTQNGTAYVPIPPQSGKSSKICPTDFLSKFKAWAPRWAVLSMGLNLLLFIILIIIALPAKKSEPSPAGAACPVAACPDGWVGYLGKCYYFSQAEGNWTYSQSHCSALGASLAAIDSDPEMEFTMRYKGFKDHWIGLWKSPGQHWKWSNGTEFNDWFPIEGGGYCAYMNYKGIASSSCFAQLHWVCRKPPE